MPPDSTSTIRKLSDSTRIVRLYAAYAPTAMNAAVPIEIWPQ